MRVFVIDNYDSFTFNLVHYLEKYCEEVRVVRNDELCIDDINEYDKILISPGPGLPSEVPALKKVLDVFAGVKPILGVCLGMQAIAEYYGGSIYNLDDILHGVPAETYVEDPATNHKESWSRGPEYGLFRPYGGTNLNEDVATFAEAAWFWYNKKDLWAFILCRHPYKARYRDKLLLLRGGAIIPLKLHTCIAAYANKKYPGCYTFPLPTP